MTPNPSGTPNQAIVIAGLNLAVYFVVLIVGVSLFVGIGRSGEADAATQAPNDATGAIGLVVDGGAAVDTAPTDEVSPAFRTAPDAGVIDHRASGADGEAAEPRVGEPPEGPARVARVRLGNADVRGSLSSVVIRRVIQDHLDEVRSCYQRQLQQTPDLQGRLSTQFVIAPTGLVQMAAISQSDLGSPPVEVCISQAVQGWTFPAPAGGSIVVVNYPFVLDSAPGQGGSAE